MSGTRLQFPEKVSLAASYPQGVGDVELALPLVLLPFVHARLQSFGVLRGVEVRDNDPEAKRTQAHHERLLAGTW